MDGHRRRRRPAGAGRAGCAEPGGLAGRAARHRQRGRAGRRPDDRAHPAGRAAQGGRRVAGPGHRHADGREPGPGAGRRGGRAGHRLAGRAAADQPGRRAGRHPGSAVAHRAGRRAGAGGRVRRWRWPRRSSRRSGPRAAAPSAPWPTRPGRRGAGRGCSRCPGGCRCRCCSGCGWSPAGRGAPCSARPTSRSPWPAWWPCSPSTPPPGRRSTAGAAACPTRSTTGTSRSCWCSRSSLLTLAALNAVVTAWSTMLDTRHPAALARALGATPRNVAAGLTAAQLLPARAGRPVRHPAGHRAVRGRGSRRADRPCRRPGGWRPRCWRRWPPSRGSRPYRRASAPAARRPRSCRPRRPDERVAARPVSASGPGSGRCRRCGTCPRGRSAGRGRGSRAGGRSLRGGRPPGW